MATRTLAEATAERAAREGRDIRLLFASSCSVYYSAVDEAGVDLDRMTEETPIAPTANYSKTKRLAELELLRMAAAEPRFCPVMLRMGTLFGYSPRMRFDLVVNTFTLDAWSRRQIVVHGSGEAWRPLLHIQDAADAYVHLMYAPAATVRAQTYNVAHKNYRILELAHWIAEILEEHRGVSVQVKRDRSVQAGSRSYFVLGEKLRRATGFRPDRGTTEAVLRIWDALESGRLGAEPQQCNHFFNIRALKEHFAAEAPA
jgi:nucleoside-diphosphate-sugar epimerase